MANLKVVCGTKRNVLEQLVEALGDVLNRAGREDEGARHLARGAELKTVSQAG